MAGKPKYVERDSLAEQCEDIRNQFLDFSTMLEEFMYHVMKKREELSDTQLADVGLTFREIWKEGTHVRKEANRSAEAVETTLGQRIVDRVLADPSTDTVVYGSLGSASARVKTIAFPPKKDSPEYTQLMEFLGVRPDATKCGAVAVHFNNLSEFVEQLERNGEQPPQVLKLVKHPACTFRRRKDDTNQEN